MRRPWLIVAGVFVLAASGAVRPMGHDDLGTWSSLDRGLLYVGAGLTLVLAGGWPDRRLRCRRGVHRALRGVLFLALSASASCGRSEPQWPPVPTSPVGHFELTKYRVLGYETDPTGAERSRIQPHFRIAIDIRADHTFRYAWTNLIEPGKDEGSVDGTWRKRDGAGWALRASNDLGTERQLTLFGVPPEELRSEPFVMPGTWFFPAVDPRTARLTDSVITNVSPPR